MKRRSVILILLFQSILTFSQPDLSTTSINNFKTGMGITAYMNNLFIPSGMKGINFSTVYQVKKIRRKEPEIIKIIDDINIRIDYSRLSNKNGEESLNHPTDFYDLNIYAGRTYNVYSGKAVAIFAGLNTGLNAGLCLNNHYSFRSHYYTPVYNEWNTFLGLSLLLSYKLKFITFENKFNMPFLLAGRWPEYGKSPETRNLMNHLNSIRFNTITGYLNTENHLTVYFSGFKSGNRQGKIFLTYTIISHSSEIQKVIQKYNKNSLYVGIILN